MVFGEKITFETAKDDKDNNWVGSVFQWESATKWLTQLCLDRSQTEHLENS